MKKVLITTIILCLTAPSVRADYLEDVRNLGYISGEGIACNAPRYRSYELVARAYLVSSAQSDEEQAEGMYAYNEAKARAFLKKRKSGLYDCGEVRERFENQEIFKTKLYKNGKLKMPDGKVIKPRQEYDVTKLYDINSNEREHLNEYYEKLAQKNIKRAQESGIYEKIRRAEATATAR